MDQFSDPNEHKIVRKERRKTLEKKFLDRNRSGSEKGVIKEENIWEMIEKLNLQKNFDKQISRKIFEELDVNKTGNINIDDFLDYISEKLHTSEFYPFYEQIMGELVGKSEKIILKLKKLKQKSYIANDTEALDDIDWFHFIYLRIISSICESDLNEPDFNTMNKITQKARKSKDFSNMGIEYISQYSQLWDKERNIKDLIQISEMNKEKIGLGLEKQLSSSEQSSDSSRRNSLDNTISPSLMANVFQNLSTIDNFDYNIFELNDLVERQTLSFISLEIFSKQNYFEEKIINEDKFRSFVKEVTKGYDRNLTYHNDLHAADVLQTTFFIIKKGYVANKLKLNVLDHFSILLSAMIHDYKHPGLNNMYHINSQGKYAIRYNDQSVMENMHVAQTFKLLSKEQYNILDLLKPEEYRLVRRRMIESVLATDMALHAKTLSTLKSKSETFDIKNGHNVDRMIFPDNLSKTYENQQTILSMILHSADISNPAKPNHIQKTWVDLVFIEFFKQGDLEKKNNLPVSLLCDRDTTNIDKSQVGFMSFVVIPSFETLLNFIPEIYQFMECIKYNLKKYEDMTKQENK